MEKYFNIKFEFNRVSFKNEIIRSINHKRKGYVCIVDGNVLANAFKRENYKNILNNSIVNSCDGSSISLIAGLIHKKKLQTYTGPEIFEDFINLGFSQIFIGNTDDVLVKLKSKLIQRKIYFSDNDFFSLPFKDVNDFDYPKIAADINKIIPQIIWVSLGAPKQEIFMSKLLPYLNSGVLFGIGAAINFYINEGSIKCAPSWMRKLHFEWLYRVFQEPNRIGKRAFQYLILIPSLIFIEINHKRKGL